MVNKFMNVYNVKAYLFQGAIINIDNILAGSREGVTHIASISYDPII